MKRREAKKVKHYFLLSLAAEVETPKVLPESQDGNKGNALLGEGALNPRARVGLCSLCADRRGCFLEVGGRPGTEGHQSFIAEQKEVAHNILLSEPRGPGGSGSGEAQNMGHQRKQVCEIESSLPLPG